MSSFLDLEAQVTVAQAEIKEVIQILELLGERGEGAFHHASVARFCLESLQDKLADFKEDYLDSANALKNAELRVQGMTQDLVTKQQAHQLHNVNTLHFADVSIQLKGRVTTNGIRERDRVLHSLLTNLKKNCRCLSVVLLV